MTQDEARQREREYSPDGGDLGRGELVAFQEFCELKTIPGYRPYYCGDTREFTLYGSSGAPASLVWRGFVREENGKHFVVAFEAYPEVY